MIGAREAADRDIEIAVDSFCHAGEKSVRKLCCEEVSLSASGRFVAELPSAAVPLLVPDLPVFLWWREDLPAADNVFAELVERADRVIIDSAEFANPGAQISALASLVTSPKENQASFSDLNWERLTAWRSLLAGFFDKQALPKAQRAALDDIANVRIDYAAGSVTAALAAQPLLITGWLASRLGWTIRKPLTQVTKSSHSAKFEKAGRQIQADFLQVERHQLQPGRLARVRLTMQTGTAFEVTRSHDGLYLETSVNDEHSLKRANVSPSHTRSIAELLIGEMDILCRDQMWEDAVRKATDIAG
jgi:glucose-6-phosphate dehydrogenase assembly protein OpcA